MNSQILFSRKNKKNITCLSSAGSLIATDTRGIQTFFFLFLLEYIYCGYSLEVPPCQPMIYGDIRNM